MEPSSVNMSFVTSHTLLPTKSHAYALLSPGMELRAVRNLIVGPKGSKCVLTLQFPGSNKVTTAAYSPLPP